MSLLQIQDIHTFYGDSHILQGVRLAVEHGMLTGVLGRNGVGKTTLIRSIMGFNPPGQGRIIYQGRDITSRAPFRIVRMGIALVPQGRQIFPNLTTRENLLIAARSAAESLLSLEQILLMFPVLKSRFETPAGRLSGGEQQMLAFGRALIGKVHLLLMDEPTEGLAPLLVAEVRGIIHQLKTQGVSMLLVEQNLKLVLKLADWVYVMSKGVITYESEPSALQENVEIKSRFLGV
ncbi:MAG: ABC transporter ATP-binding protein [Deltaproteobacteria bacterium HGW-Deltaproteobacteria-21]|nr:MAG: ABC transporter ATP-binding protein [Deltaproteobacteria bacterium HGW-Deltaproteobacteria-21]